MSIAFNLIGFHMAGHNWMKQNPLTRSMPVSIGFNVLETIYTLFHPDETAPISLLITLVTYHHFCLYGTPFNENEIPTRTGLS
jgi:hypothetical protein